MTRANVTLVILNGNGGSSSPGGTSSYVLPQDPCGEETQITQIVEVNDGDFDFRPETDENIDTGIEDGLLAKINSGQLSLIVEPLVDRVFIEIPPGSRFARKSNPDRIAIPKSAAEIHHYLHLRDSDIVNFDDHGLKIRVVMELPNSAEHTSDMERDMEEEIAVEQRENDQGQDEVQVISSDVEQNVTTTNGIADDDATDSEADLDNVSFAKTPQADTTPATSKMTAPTIKETPNAQRAAAENLADTASGDAEPFSTAREAANDDMAAALSDGPEESSPSYRAKSKFAAGHGFSAEQTAIKPRSEVLGSSDYDSDNEPMSETPNVGRTYSRKGNARAKAQQSPEPEALAGSIDEVDATLEDDIKEEDVDDVDTNFFTSEPLKEAQVAKVVVERSMKGSKRKVKSSAGDDDELDEIDAPRPKKRKSLRTTASHEEETRESTAPATRSKKGRLSRPTRHSSAETEGEIVVADGKPRVSPQVIVNPQSSGSRARATDTPSSTATSTALSSKTPKILLSSDSTLHKSAKWLKDHGSEIIDDVKTRRTHFVCVVKDGHIKTAKALRSLALGKLVVTEDWVVDSKKAGQLLETDDYIPTDLKENISVDRRRLFHGKNIFATATLADKVYMQGWPDIVNLAKDAGASAVFKGHSGEFEKFARSGKNETIVLGADNNDEDAFRLQTQSNCTVYRKSLLTDAIITGQLDLDNEDYKLPAASGVAKKR